MHHQPVDCQAEGGCSHAFDRSASEDLTNTAYLAIDNVLHTVGITAGAATGGWGAGTVKFMTASKGALI